MAIAALSDSPASTLIVSRSSVSDSVRRISFLRSSTRLFSTESGTMNPTKVSRPTATNEIKGAGRSMTVQHEASDRTGDGADHLEGHDPLGIPSGRSCRRA